MASVTTAIAQPNALVKTIKFGFFEPIVLVPTVEEVKNPQGSGGNARSQINANDDDEGWTLVTRRRSGKKNSPKLAKAPERSKMVRQSTKKKGDQEKSHSIQAQKGIQAKAKEANNSERVHARRVQR